jgi:hypothetical protein
MKSASVNVPRQREQRSVSPPTPVPNGGTLPPLVSVHLNALLAKVKPQ